MELYVVRHPPPDIAPGVCYGQLDMPIRGDVLPWTLQVRAQVPPVERRYSSPLLRCRTLAHSLWSPAEVELDERLRELHFGNWEGVAWNDIAQPELNQWMMDYARQRVPGGEGFPDLQARVEHWLEERHAEKPDTLAVVAHKGVIAALRVLNGQMTLAEALKAPVEYGEVVHLRF